MPPTFEEIRDAFDFADINAGADHHAVVCRRTGKIHTYSEFAGDKEFDDDEPPDDVEDEEKYLAIPGKRDLDLGKSLVLDFAREFLPDDFDDVRYMFSKRGAYRKFRALLTRRKGALERWYAFEAKATERALRQWCEANSIELAE